MGKYSETLMEHFASPRNVGRLDGADRIGRAGTLGRGPFMVLYLRLSDGIVTEARYQSHGCGTTIASGSVLTELILGKTVEECRALSPEAVRETLDGVPPDKLHCPALAVAALRSALDSEGKLPAEGEVEGG